MLWIVAGSGRRFRRQEAGSSWADLVLGLSSCWAVGPARRTRRGKIDLAAPRRGRWTRRVATAVPDWQQLGDRNSGQCNIL